MAGLINDESTNTRLYTDVCSIIEQGRREAYASVNQKMIETYWNIGRRIVEEEQNGEERAEYGAKCGACVHSCPHRPKAWRNHTSRCWSNGYVRQNV